MRSIDFFWFLGVVPLTAAIALIGDEARSDDKSPESDLIAYEGFDYENAHGSLIGLNGGVGFVGPWKTGGMPSSSCSNYKLAPGPIEGMGVVSTGKLMSAAAANTMTGMRRILRRRVGIEGETIYFSVIMRPTGKLGEGIYDGFFGFDRDSTEATSIDALMELWVGLYGQD